MKWIKLSQTEKLNQCEFKYIILIFIYFLFSIIIASSCHKKASTNPTSYSSKMGGMRVWHGTLTNPKGTFHTGAPDTTYFIIDTFAINVINDSTITTNKHILYYIDTFKLYDYSDSTITYIVTNPQYQCCSIATDISITYNYLNNSIIYDGFWPSHGGPTSIKLYTP